MQDEEEETKHRFQKMIDLHSLMIHQVPFMMPQRRLKLYLLKTKKPKILILKILKTCSRKNPLKLTSVPIESTKTAIKSKKYLHAILVAQMIIELCYFVKNVLLKNSMLAIITSNNMQTIIHVIVENSVTWEKKHLVLNINQQK